MGNWLIVAGVFNLATMCIVMILSFKAEWIKYTQNYVTSGVLYKGIEWTFYLFLLFSIGWNCYGSDMVAKSNQTECSGELYNTTLGYVVSCWILLFLRAVWRIVQYFERVNRIEKRKKTREEKKMG